MLKLFQLFYNLWEPFWENIIKKENKLFTYLSLVSYSETDSILLELVNYLVFHKMVRMGIEQGKNDVVLSKPPECHHFVLLFVAKGLLCSYLTTLYIFNLRIEQYILNLLLCWKKDPQLFVCHNNLAMKKPNTTRWRWMPNFRKPIVIVISNIILRRMVKNT